MIIMVGLVKVLVTVCTEELVTVISSVTGGSVIIKVFGVVNVTGSVRIFVIVAVSVIVGPSKGTVIGDVMVARLVSVTVSVSCSVRVDTMELIMRLL